MQVGCGCQMDPDVAEVSSSIAGEPVGMDPVFSWDKTQPSIGGFVRGRRYMWQCPTCGNVVCINLTLLNEDWELKEDE